MPKLYLAFNMETEREDYEMAVNGAKYKFALDDLDNFLRHVIKYDDGDNGRARIKVMQEVRDKLREIMNEEL